VTDEDLPLAEFGFPGPLRDRLVAAVLVGEKTATTSLFAQYERAGEALPVPGRAVVVDSAERPVAVIETLDVRVVPLGEIDLDLARAEGEGFTSVADWRAAHERFWHQDAIADLLGGSEPPIDDSTLVVTERFRLVSRME
jgi:uncharacterized protein YhfF